MHVSLLGPKGSYSFLAAKKFYRGRKWSPIFSHSIKGVFQNLKNGEADFGIVPIRNKTLGVIFESERNLRQKVIVIRGTIKLPVQFYLAVPRGIRKEDIRTLVSASFGFRQCMRFIKKYFPKVPRRVVSTTSAAFPHTLRQKYAAAIGSREAARYYGFRVINKNIQDEKDDWTEFVIFSFSGRKTNRDSRQR